MTEATADVELDLSATFPSAAGQSREDSILDFDFPIEAGCVILNWISGRTLNKFDDLSMENREHGAQADDHGARFGLVGTARRKRILDFVRNAWVWDFWWEQSS